MLETIADDWPSRSRRGVSEKDFKVPFPYPETPSNGYKASTSAIAITTAAVTCACA